MFTPSQQTVRYLPNMGRPKGVVPPLDLGALDVYKDRDVYKPVYILDAGQGVSAAESHIAIIWLVGTSTDKPPKDVHRMLDVRQEANQTHLTNWGPLTRIDTLRTMDGRKHHIATISLKARETLEAIARAEQVEVPNGRFNCHAWTRNVLAKAVQYGVFTTAQVNDVWNRLLAPRDTPIPPLQ